jgi:hypothetical protein
LSNPQGLTILDEMIGSLSRSGPGREVTFDLRPKKGCTLLRECLPLLGGLKVKPTKWVIPGESVFEAIYFCRAVLEVLNDSIPKIGLLPLVDQLSLFIQAKDWPRESFIKFAKYTTAWPMARYLHQELPTVPVGFLSNPLVFKGRIRRILKNRLVSFNNKNTRLWAGYLQGVKRGCAVVSEDFILENMLKHKLALSNVPEANVFDIVEYSTYFYRFFLKFPPSTPRLVEASPAASWQSVRSEGGAREFVRKTLQAELSFPELLSMQEIYPGKVQPIYGVAAPTLTEVRSFAAMGTQNVKVSAVCEPLKVRLITKGDSFKYWFSRFYQKDLWNYLQKFPQFSLTGRPLGIDDLDGLLSRERKLGLCLPDWVSGDYSAATDGLNLWFTKLAFEASLDKSKLRPFDQDLLRDVLYEQRIHYPEPMVKLSKGALSSFLQTNGQLMGSVLSFPILCTINLVCYWVALEKYTGKKIEMEDLPVLVNGDDILFRSDSRLYQLWLEEISRVGFTLSLGKNYVHPRVLTVNSQLYTFTNGRFTFLGYLNTGLLTGQSKLTGRDTAKDAPVWALYNETVRNAVRPSRAHRRFLHYNKELIDRSTNHGEYNLFLPFSRGGLGFTRPELLSNRLTSFQRRWAYFLKERKRASVEKGELPPRFSLGLVQERGFFTKPLFLRHRPALTLEPIFGPYNKGILPFEEKEYKFPILARPYDFDRPKLSFRFPSKTIKASFRESFKDGLVLRLSTKEIYTPDLRLCSSQSLIELEVPESESPNL